MIVVLPGCDDDAVMMTLTAPHPRAERLADDIVVVECPMSTLPDVLRLHSVEPDSLAAFKENDRIPQSYRRGGSRITCTHT